MFLFLKLRDRVTLSSIHLLLLQWRPCPAGPTVTDDKQCGDNLWPWGQMWSLELLNGAQLKEEMFLQGSVMVCVTSRCGSSVSLLRSLFVHPRQGAATSQPRPVILQPSLQPSGLRPRGWETVDR